MPPAGTDTLPGSDSPSGDLLSRPVSVLATLARPLTVPSSYRRALKTSSGSIQVLTAEEPRPLLRWVAQRDKARQEWTVRGGAPSSWRHAPIRPACPDLSAVHTAIPAKPAPPLVLHSPYLSTASVTHRQPWSKNMKQKIAEINNSFVLNCMRL